MPTDLITRLEQRRARPAAREWYRIEAAEGSSTATVHIYDEIGLWGTSARDFAAELRAIDATAIELHLNSPGGDAFDGLAIYNSLRDHPATVTVVVDGLAASAASVIAMAGDVVKMNVGAQMMIHEASGVVIGNAGDMADFATVLDKASDSLAATYVAKAGGTLAEWREVMRAETWYTAAEAVEAGLADEAVTGAEPAAEAAFDRLRVFAYAGRSAAPPPVIHRRPAPPPVTAAEAARRIHAASTRTTTPTAQAAGSTRGGSMDPAKIREALGLSADASDEQVMAALTAARPPAPEPEPTPGPTPPAPTAAGTMSIDVSAWQAQQDRIQRLEAADAKRRRDERDQILAQAVADGKFAPGRVEHWVRLWDADPEGTRLVIDGLAKNVIPIAALGYDADREGTSIDEEFSHLFPPTTIGKGR